MNVLVLNAGSASLKFEVITALTNDDTVFHRIPDQASTYLLILQTESFHPHGLTPEAFADLFTLDKPVVFNFHGYPVAVKQLLFHQPTFSRFQINGYIEEGTTTTPFDLFVQNEASRYHVAMQAVRAAAENNSKLAAQADHIVSRYEQKLIAHHDYITKHGQDMPEIVNWKWT